jgi:quercetin dioxygenase-like cupin family protein
MRFLIVGVLALALADGQMLSLAVDPAKVQWQSVEIPGVPNGMLQKPLHANKDNGMMSMIIRFPKGFRDPKHYHTTCAHSLYVIKGKLQTPDGLLTPGMFLYSARNERHGPLVAIEETDMLIYTDGPLDYHVAE